MNFDLNEVLVGLRSDRPVFYSEADFQHALAWAIHKHHPKLGIRLEVPFVLPSMSGYLDLLINGDEQSIAIEIKYKTRNLSVQVGSEEFRLRSQSAQDLGRYDFFRDLQRVESLCGINTGWLGWVVFLTNDSSYWKKPGRPTVAYEDFRMEEERAVSGTLTWASTAGTGTTKDREDPIQLSGSYRLNWRKYSEFGQGGYSRFRYLMVPVGNVA